MVYILNGNIHDIAPDPNGLYTAPEFGVSKKEESVLVEKIQSIHPEAKIYTGKYTTKGSTTQLTIPSRQLSEVKHLWETEGFHADFASVQILIISLWASIEHSVRSVLLETLNYDILNLKIATARHSDTDYSEDIVDRSFDELKKRVQQGSKANLFGELAATILGSNLKKLLRQQGAEDIFLHVEALYNFRNLISHGSNLQFHVEITEDYGRAEIVMIESKVYKQVHAIFRSYSPDRPDPCRADGSPRWDELSGADMGIHFWSIAREFVEVLNEAVPEYLRGYLAGTKSVLDSGIHPGGYN